LPFGCRNSPFSFASFTTSELTAVKIVSVGLKAYGQDGLFARPGDKYYRVQIGL
jgi:hypothetical protein